ncbi:NAD(P)H-dependent flavin oxidoreductase [Paracoccus aminovorans]|uniref:NAD(P)H-dependent flavin oxidoreductase n=1 Tax=Paracoccus aminovorans TaxID=34004 RepID=UPI002B25D2DD|nr:nitronate monooxygenase [Paracoccus aminovorans]
MSILTDLEIPVLQAPMAGTATPALAAETSRAGALGGLGLATAGAEQAAAMMAEVQARLGSNRYHVNLFCHRPAHADPAREAAWLDYLAPEFRRAGAEPPAALREIFASFLVSEGVLEAVLAARPAMVSFHFGLPHPDQLATLRGTGALLAGSATSLAEGRAIRDAGLDAIIAQGYEAGGHRGIFRPEGEDAQLPTMDLLSALEPLGLPLVAAGGVMDGRDAVRFLDAGAVAVQMGTAFVACPESAASAAHRARLGQPGQDTVMTSAISGRPARGFRNRLTDLGAAAEAPPLPDYPITYDAGKALAAAAGTDYAAQWAGTGSARARAMPAAELVAALGREIAEARKTA